MTEQEEMALRELAANPHYIDKVREVLGPLSLWSSQGLQDHVRKAVEAEREACAQVCEALEIPDKVLGAHPDYLSGKHMAVFQCATAIRARGNT